MSDHRDMRDAELDLQWRRYSSELPPPEVDARILAAAHREAGARPQAVDGKAAGTKARKPFHGGWSLAVAATIGAFAFGLLQLAPVGERSGPQVASDMPSASDAAVREKAAAPAPERAGQAPATMPSAIAPPPRLEMQRPTPAPMAMSAPRSADASAAQRPPEQWVATIVTLMKEEKRDEAARELNRFRAAYPDADERLPAALREWARGVRQ